MTRIKTVFWLRLTIDLEAAGLLGRYPSERRSTGDFDRSMVGHRRFMNAHQALQAVRRLGADQGPLPGSS